MGREVILTFDDGPDREHTPRLLDALAKANVQAAFFVSGQSVALPGNLEVVKRAAREGHVIGNHGYSHTQLTKLSPEEVRLEILRTHDLIAEVEPPQKLFRPPYGAYNEIVEGILRDLDYRLTLWNVDPEDWRETNQPAMWIDVAINQIRERTKAVCLCHDVHASTVENMETFMNRIRELDGAYFGSADRALSMDAASNVRRVWSWFLRRIQRLKTS